MEKKFVITELNAKEYIQKIGKFIHDFVYNAKKDGVVIGMSGGIDCSVVARLAQEANVKIKLIIMPDGNNMVESASMKDALDLIEKFNFDYEIINIKPICDGFEQEINNLSEISRINIRPRVRMTMLYALAQTNNLFVIGTSNLDERLLGYFTKWGDGASDLNPLGYLTKREVRILAKSLNIPNNIITKAPSADLFLGQTDEEDLGVTYEQIDQYILNGSSGDANIDQIINRKITFSAHKLMPITIFNE